MISIQNKKACIEWFLMRHQVKDKDLIYLLHYITHHSSLLEQVHFVYDVKYTKRGLFIAAADSDAEAFVFYKDGLVTKDVEKAFHDLRMNKQEPMYIEFHFKQIRHSVEYHGVLEENPYVDHHILSSDEHAQLSNDMDQLIVDVQLKQLKEKIDRALDFGDDEAFIKYVNELATFKKKFNLMD